MNSVKCNIWKHLNDSFCLYRQMFLLRLRSTHSKNNSRGSGMLQLCYGFRIVCA